MIVEDDGDTQSGVQRTAQEGKVAMWTVASLDEWRFSRISQNISTRDDDNNNSEYRCTASGNMVKHSYIIFM